MDELGYELLYRTDSEDQATFADGDEATAELTLNTVDIGKPQLVEGKPTSVNRLLTLHMIAILTNPDIKINEIVKTISLDAGLALKLLRFSNSAMAGIQRPVDSISHAVVLIGMERIRIWASLLLLHCYMELTKKPATL